MSFETLDFLLERSQSGKTMVLAVAAPHGEDILGAVAEAKERGVVSPILYGDRSRIEKIASELSIDVSSFNMVEEPDEGRSAELAVKAVSSGEADLLMKGNVKTATLLKAVLNKEWGLRSGSLLSHVFLFQIPKIGKVFCMTDGGMSMYPDLAAKQGIIENAVECYHKLGIQCPRVALLAAVEVVNQDMPCTIDAAALTQMNRRGQIKGCIVDGPLALDNAVSEESARHKGIVSEVAGKADILVVPDIEAGNLMGKVMLYMSGGRGAGVIVGARKPIVLTSRFDNAETKLLSIAFGAVLAKA
ncbi:MAG: bifunctional enoyl-CoA hydratase/phosphate acetyltransferase [Thermovirgaceae bacterium]|nr:bifunctional enoyl-CoA hydratase/phosphate acetyltransferase [Synergistales bacterium]HOI81599.1 bifunctional enoyl-CoA hydratase/phosphate acetyltransferase [Synergistales bacterium]HPE91789.1 bifunctional enoyl-CoA hydratase/phosphate acetyltransferase [Synergistales bacterium]